MTTSTAPPPTTPHARVLLVTHEASLSGAPRVAELVAQTLGNAGARVEIVSRRPGELAADLGRAGRFRVEPLHRVRRRLGVTPGLGRLSVFTDTLLAAATIARSRADLVYLNSTASIAYLRAALLLRRRVIVHSHESREVALRFLGPARAQGLLRRAELVGCSPSAAADLADLSGVPADRVLMLASVPDAERVTRLAGTPEAPASSADTADGAVVVGCVGAVEHRKGADLWPRIAELVRATVPDVPVRFVWVGPQVGEASGPPELFAGPRANPYPQMARFDVMVLPSRDDPFPLVVLEAMVLARPVVAFGVGGVPTQIGDAGVVVGPGDVETLAEEVAALVADPVRRQRLGRRAAARAAEIWSTAVFARDLLKLARSKGSAA